MRPELDCPIPEIVSKPALSLNFQSSGSGKPLLALHGYGASLFSWRCLPSALPKRRVICVDLPGHGGSPPPADGRYSLADLARQVAGLIDELKLEEFDLAGHSLGGGVALMTALEISGWRTHAIGRLILVGSVALPQPLPFFIKLVRVPFAGALLLSQLPERQIVRSVLRGAFHDPCRITGEMVQTYAQNLASAAGRQALIETARQIVPDNLPELVSRYRSLRVPTLLVWGKQDRVVPPSIGIALNTLVEGSKLLMIEGCGHMPHEERPEVVIPAIARFLADGV